MRALILIVLASVTLSAYAGSCLLGLTESKAVDEHTTTCPQYAGDSCCAATFTESSCTSFDGCRREPDSCSFLLSLLNCGTLCKPNFYNDFVEQVTKVRLCENFYDALQDACVEITHCDTDGNRSIDCRQKDNQGYCKRVYDNNDDFWKKHLPGGVIRSSDKCFSAGFAVVPSAILLALAVILALFH